MSHSGNYIKLNFVVVSHKIFLARLFCAPLPAAPLLRHCLRAVCLKTEDRYWPLRFLGLRVYLIPYLGGTFSVLQETHQEMR